MLWLALLSLLLAVLLYHSTTKRRILRHGRRLRCPPNTLPFLGNALKFLQPRHSLFAWFVSCQRQFGLESFQISVLSLPPGIVINDPVNLEYVLKNEASITKGDFFKKRSWDLFGHGIINADGELWRAQRKAGLKFFSGANLEALIDVVLPKFYASTRKCLLQHAADSKQLDLQALFFELTTAVVGHMAYDQSTKMDIPASSPFSSAFDYASDQVGRRFQNPLYQITEIFTGSKFRSAVSEVQAFGCQIVAKAQEHQSKMAYERKSIVASYETAYGSLIDSLTDSFDSPTLIADSALNFLSAARDTTAQSLTWTFYMLVRHPSVVPLIQEEIKRTCPYDYPKGNGNTTALPLRAADLQPTNLPYLMSIFYESLRLHPPIPFEIRQCQTDTTLPDGTFLPPGSIIVWCIWAMNRAVETWGPDADAFRPDRWLTDSGSKFVSKSAYEFPVFNGGPRSCLGKKMAELIAMYLLVNLVREFDFEEIRDDDDGGGDDDGLVVRKERVSKNSLTLPMEGGLPCLVRKRSNL